MSLGSAPSSEKVSPPSSTEAQDNQYAARLKFHQEPPQHVFVNEEFLIHLTLELPSNLLGETTISNTTVHLSHELFQYSQGKILPNPVTSTDLVQLTIVQPSPLSIDIDGRSISSSSSAKDAFGVKATCTLRSPINRNTPTRYCIKIRESLSLQRESSSPSTSFRISSVTSRPIQVVKAKIKIDTLNWEEKWFKDEGGRDKCMSAIASLINSEGHAITDRRVPLALTLMYNNEQKSKVSNQKDVLRLLGQPHPYIDKDRGNGKTTIQFRVEDVSKNHRGLGFRLQVAPDSSNADIAPAYTPSVMVRSKQSKKRPRDRDSSQHSGSQEGRGTVNSPWGTTAGGRTGSGGQPPNPIIGYQNQYSAHQLRQAMKGVISWTEAVVNGLHSLKWQVIGYAQLPDGSPDYGRPYNSMPNPNEAISRILDMYNHETRDFLQVILGAVNSSTTPNTIPPPQQQHQPMQQQPPQPPTDMYNLDPMRRTSYGATAGGKPASAQASVSSTTNQSALNPSPANLPGTASAFDYTYPTPYSLHPSPATMRNPLDPLTQQQQQHQPQSQSQHQPLDSLYHPSPHLPPMRPDRMHPTDHHLPLHSQHSTYRSTPSLPLPQRDDTITTPTRNSLSTSTTAAATAAGIGGGIGGHFEMNQEAQAEAELDHHNSQADVEYVLAKKMKSKFNDALLFGYPAYNIGKKLIGFYKESHLNVGGHRFIPITKYRTEFGQMELNQSTAVLEEAIAKRSRAVHKVTEWESLSTMVDQVVVYDWSKDALTKNAIMGDDSNSSNETEI